MNNNLISDNKINNFINNDLEELLLNLTKYGKPRLNYMGKGWFAVIDIYVNVIGAELEIKSEFDHKTPKEAVIVLINRLNETIEKISKTKGFDTI